MKSRPNLKTIMILTTSFITINSTSVAAFDVSESSVSQDKKIQMHGNFEFEYWDADGSAGTFDAHKLLLWTGIQLSDKAFVSAEVEYEHAPVLKGSGGKQGEVKLDSAQLRLMPTTTTSAYFGIFYAPFGIEYMSYPAHKNKLITRPKVMKSGSIVPGTWSDVGMGVNQVINGVGQLDVFVLNGDAKNGGISREKDAGGNDSKTIGARFMLDQMVDGLNAGISFVNGNYDEGNDNAATLTGIHLRLDSEKMTNMSAAPVFIMEYVTGNQAKNSAVSDDTGTALDKKMNGYYLQLSSKVLTNMEVAVRYGSYDNDTEITDNAKSETSVGITWHLPRESVQIKAEYQMNAESANETDNNVFVTQIVANW
jgi:hypothetical protein